MKNFIGIDIGGTKIEVQLFTVADVDLNSAPSFKIKKRIPTNRLEGKNYILNSLNLLIDEVLKEAQLNISQISGIGIGLPGSVDPATQMMLQGNTAVLINANFITSIQEYFKCQVPIKVNNDANCFAIAEVMFGVGKHHEEQYKTPIKEQIAIGLILGTGVGGAIIIRSEILVGRHGAAAELGHTSLYKNGHACYCMKHGCAEQYLSGSAIESQFNSRRYAALNKVYTSIEIFDLATKKEPLALATIHNYKNDLCDFISNLTNTFDPDYFVLGGGLSNQDIIYQGLEERVWEKTFLESSRPKIYKNLIGDSAGTLGSISEFLI